MARQIPHGDADLVCPLHRATMDTVCHTCPWWEQIRGRHPQTGEEIDKWACAVAMLPMLLIETAGEARAGTKATLDFRNEVVKQRQEQLHNGRAIIEALPIMSHNPAKS